MTIGGRFKLLENYTVNLMFVSDIFNGEEVAQSLELEFDPTDHNIFYFSTSDKLYKCNRRESETPI